METPSEPDRSADDGDVRLAFDAQRRREVVAAAPDGATVIAKVRMILEALPGADDVVSISELAREIGLSKSTVSRICSELIAWGVVARVGQAVQLGARLGELGSRAPLEPGATTCQDSLVELASPHMVDLHTEVRRAVSLSVLADTDTMCVARIAGRSDVGRAIDVGERGPAHLTAAGRALLAHGTKSDVDRVLGRPLRRLTRYSMVSRDLLLRELQEVERTGIAVIREEMRLGRSSMAVPVFSARSGRAVAAIAVPSVDGRLSANDERLLRRCGAAVTATLVERNGGAAPSPARLRGLS